MMMITRCCWWTCAAFVTGLFVQISSFYLGAAAPFDGRYRHRVERRVPFLGLPVQDDELLFGRHLQTNNSTSVSIRADTCSLCNGFSILQEKVPPYVVNEETPEGLTCQDWADITSTFPLDYYDTSPCQYMQSTFAGECCDTPPTFVCEENVRNFILANHDTAVAPIANSKLNVGTLLEFYHITDLDLKSATAEIFTWLHMNWTDPRLAWNNASLEQELCATSVTVRASLNAEITEIWVPDYDLLNQATGVQKFPESMATVYPDGTVSWIRNGGMRALCWLSGLRAFPYDTLGCGFLFGGWTKRDNIRFILGGENGDGFNAGDNVDEIKYTEYNLKVKDTETGYYQGSENFVFYNFYFERAERYYVTKIVIPTVIFTFLSFAVFLLDPRVGERLTYGLTVLLVIIAQDIVTSERLPVANERLWINVFSNASFYWVLVALLESVFVMWLYFLQDNETHAKKDDGHDEDEIKDGDTLRQNGNDRESDTEEGQDLTYSGSPSLPVESSSPPTTRQRGMQSLRQKSAITFKHLLIASGPKNRLKYRLIKKFDTICFLVVPTSYAIFVIVMLTSKSLWQNEKLAYFGENEAE